MTITPTERSARRRARLRGEPVPMLKGGNPQGTNQYSPRRHRLSQYDLTRAIERHRARKVGLNVPLLKRGKKRP